MDDYKKLCEELQEDNERLKEGVDILNSYIIQLENQKEDMWIEIERLKKQLETAVDELHGNCSSCVNYTESHNQGKCKSCIHEIFPRENPKEDNWRWEGETNV